MSIRYILCAAAFCSLVAPQCASAIPLANSIAEFSGTQGSDNWFYGFYNRTDDASPPYNPGDFVQFANYEVAVPPPSPAPPPIWRADIGQLNTPGGSGIGVFNNTYLGVDAVGGHPTGIGPDDQDLIVWAVRRYISETAGQIDIAIDVHRLNDNARGNGITARVFVNGNEIYSTIVTAPDGTATQTTLLATVGVGSIIDFAIDPTGVLALNVDDDIASARSDGTYFSALISTHEAPTPSTLALFFAAFASLAGLRRFSRNVAPARAA